MDTKSVDKIIKLRKAGLTLREIEKIVEVSRETARHIIQKYELKKVSKNNNEKNNNTN